MGTTWAVGERVIWLSRFDYDESVTRVDAEIMGVAHGQVLIRVLEHASRRHPEQLVERWVEPESLRRRASKEGRGSV